MKTFMPVLVVAVLGLAGWVSIAGAHCEIPCGIYGDELRFELLTEHIETIEKSMNQIVELSGNTPINYNQLVRWVTNKDEHASEFQHVISQYFMTQRVKPVDPATDRGYARKIFLLHAMLFEAMRCKQMTDTQHVDLLKKYLGEFHDLYFGADAKKHLEEHHK